MSSDVRRPCKTCDQEALKMASIFCDQTRDCNCWQPLHNYNLPLNLNKCDDFMKNYLESLDKMECNHHPNHPN